jgi:hypothetical protein
MPSPAARFSSGWSPTDVSTLLDKLAAIPNHAPLSNKTILTNPRPSFDVLIFRIPHGWIQFDAIDENRLRESLQLAHDLFGVKTAIVSTLPMNNNVFGNHDLVTLKNVNKMIQSFVDSYRLEILNNTSKLMAHYDTSNTTIDYVMLMDFARLENELTMANAKVIGLDTSSTNFSLSRLGGRSDGCAARYPPSKAMVCAEDVRGGSCDCKLNAISLDGSHWCMGSIGGKVVGGFACLMQCPLKFSPKDVEKLQECEEECNANFMSLTDLVSD